MDIWSEAHGLQKHYVGTVNDQKALHLRKISLREVFLQKYEKKARKIKGSTLKKQQNNWY